jgi:heat shock protein HslJ
VIIIYSIKQQKLYYSYVFLTMCILVIISCKSTKKTQQVMAVENKVTGNIEQSSLQSKYKDGIDFFASGMDDEWELNLDFEKDFTFKRSDGFKFSTPAVEGIKAQDTNIIRYRAMVESGEMIIHLCKQECVKSSNGNLFPYKVTVEIKRGIDKDFYRVEGCGHFVFDKRIHDIWVLLQLSNKLVTGPDLPYIEFNTTDGSLMGQTGCNNFSGKADFKGNKVILGPLAATRKFCPNATYESDFLKAMSPGEWMYEIENGKLVLTRNGQESIMFKKVD